MIQKSVRNDMKLQLSHHLPDFLKNQTGSSEFTFWLGLSREGSPPTATFSWHNGAPFNTTMLPTSKERTTDCIRIISASQIAPRIL